MLNGTKWLLIAEIRNEINGGDSPATLVTALESANGGYNPDCCDKMNMRPIQDELKALIVKHGPEMPAADLLADADWESYANGSLQHLAIEMRKKPSKVLVVMSEDTGAPAGISSEDPSIRVEVIWNTTEWEEIPRGYKTLARIWGFKPDEEIEK